jgi:hypothetical protein
MKISVIFILGIVLLAFVSGCSSKVVIEEENLGTAQEQATTPAEITDSTNDLIDPNEEVDVGEVI